MKKIVPANPSGSKPDMGPMKKPPMGMKSAAKGKPMATKKGRG